MTATSVTLHVRFVTQQRIYHTRILTFLHMNISWKFQPQVPVRCLKVWNCSSAPN